MNILLTCPDDTGTGGVQRVFRDLIQALENESRTVHLLYQAPLRSLRAPQKTNGWGRTALYCPMGTVVKDNVLLSVGVFLFYLPVALFHLVRFLRRHAIDVVNCHYLSEYFSHVIIAARLLRIPVVVSVHGADVDRYARVSAAERLLLRLVTRGSDRIVACSAAMAAQTREAFPAARHKVTYVHSGLHLAQFALPDGVVPVRGPFVLSVCRQVDKKGVDTVLRAFALLAADFPDVTLVVIGDGPVLDKNRALARTIGIESRVVFLGDMTHSAVLPYFATCSLFVVPSRAEPFGLVVLEAACYKKAMVCTRVGGIPEIVTDNVSALLVEPDDPPAMASRMAILLRDRHRAEALGSRAHETLVARFRWENRVKDYLAVYEGAERPRPGAVDPATASSCH